MGNFYTNFAIGGGHQIISTLKVKMVKEGGGGYMTSVILV